GGDNVILPNISTSDCLIFFLIKKKIIKNSGNSIFLKNGSIDFLVKIKFLNKFFLNKNLSIFLNIKNFFSCNFNFRKKIKKNNNFNIINTIINIFLNNFNIIGVYSLKL
ncbi:hypothetical protein K5B08_01185, partial [Candidatus Carsonella ruddii]|nr:hypothetical protein [Candidatus Carsonella ruddii]